MKGVTLSCNRENVVWQSKNGTWNRGFFDYYDVNTDDPDWDYEWDVEYDMDTFNWVSTGHQTKEMAHASWDGSNPGGSWVIWYSPETAQECDEYDAMAKTYKEKYEAQQRRYRNVSYRR